MVKWDYGTHRGTVGANGFLQYGHASDQIRDGPLATGHVGLRYDIEMVHVCEIERKSRLHCPNWTEDKPYLSYKKNLTLGKHDMNCGKENIEPSKPGPGSSGPP